MSARHTIDGQEIIAYGDMYEYVEDADFTSYEWSGAKQKEFMVRGFKPIDDDDFKTYSDSIIELNDGELYQKVWFGEDFDQPDQYVKESCLDDEVFIIYEWNEARSIYTPFNGVVYADEDDANEKITEIVGTDWMYSPEMGTIGKREDYKSMHEGEDFNEWASNHLTRISLGDSVEVKDVFTEVETDTMEVEVGIDRTCGICGRPLPAHETHCEDVLICDGFVLAVLDTYHMECE